MPPKKPLVKATVVRLRPQLNTSISKQTVEVLNAVREEMALPSIGATIDFVVNDWKKIRAAAGAAALREAEVVA